MASRLAEGDALEKAIGEELEAALKEFLPFTSASGVKSGGSGGGGGGGGGGEIEEVRKFSLGAEAAGRAALNDWEPRQVFGRSSTGVVMSISRLAAEAEEHYSCLPAEEGAKDKAEALVHDLVTFVQKARAYALQLEKTAPAQAQRLETEAADAVQAVEDQFMEPLKAADSAIKAVAGTQGYCWYTPWVGTRMVPS